MNDLENLLTRVEQVPLPPDTRQRHLAELLRAQNAFADDRVARAAGDATGPPAATATGPSRTRSRSMVTTGLAAAAVVIVAGGAWLLTGQPAPQENTGAGPAPATSSASPNGATEKHLSGSETAKATGSKTAPGEEQNLLTSPEGIKLLASTLGVSLDKAAAAAKQLVAIADAGGGIDPRSARFAGVASSLGVTPERLTQAITHIKVSLDPKFATGQPKQVNTDKAGTATGTKAATSDKQNLLTSPAAIKLLASTLGVSQDKAAAAAKRLIDLADANNGIDPGSAAFAAVASTLGVTPAQLEHALAEVKRSG